jgi:hypothetical protein
MSVRSQAVGVGAGVASRLTQVLTVGQRTFGRNTVTTGALLSEDPITVRNSPNEASTIDDRYYMEKLDSYFFERLKRVSAPTLGDFRRLFSAFEQEFKGDLNESGPMMGSMYMTTLSERFSVDERMRIASSRYLLVG